MKGGEGSVRRFPVAVALIVVLCLIAVGCAKPPTEEIAAAKAAVRSARDEGAAVYAAAEFSSATKALSDAETGVATKRYDEARASAMLSKERADAAKMAAIKNKAAAKVDAEAAVSQAETALGAAAESLSGAPKGKGADEDVAQLNMDLERATSLLAGARQKVDAEDYYGALAEAERIFAEAQRIQEAVEIARENLAKAKEKAPWWTGAGEK